jgi:hypothetical protein
LVGEEYLGSQQLKRRPQLLDALGADLLRPLGLDVARERADGSSVRAAMGGEPDARRACVVGIVDALDIARGLEGRAPRSRLSAS